MPGVDPPRVLRFHIQVSDYGAGLHKKAFGGCTPLMLRSRPTRRLNLIVCGLPPLDTRHDEADHRSAAMLRTDDYASIWQRIDGIRPVRPPRCHVQALLDFRDILFRWCTAQQVRSELLFLW